MEKKSSILMLGALVLFISISLGVGLYVLLPQATPISQIQNLPNTNLSQNTSTGTTQRAVTSKPAAQTQTSPTPSTSGLKTYREPVYGYQFSYSTKIFNLFAQTDKPPVVYNSSNDGVKIISSDRVSYLNTEKCVYGKSSMTQTCTLGNEAGISFVVANAAIKAITVPYEGSLVSTTVAKKSSYIYSASTNSVGMSTDTYFIPLNSTHTLVITRLYRSDGFPDKTQLDQVVSTLKLN